MKLLLFACDVMKDEMSILIENNEHQIDLHYVVRDEYHNFPKRSANKLQQELDSIPEGYDYILVGYAYCNRLIEGMTSRHTPLVIPRAHDCLTLFMGSRKRYLDEFHENPGSYYFTRGFLTANTSGYLQQQSVPDMLGEGIECYEDMVEKYGEDNAKYLLEVLGSWKSNYKRGVLIQLPMYDQSAMAEEVQNICQTNNWNYAELQGNLSLLGKLTKGEWDQDFLIVQPGQSVTGTNDDGIIAAR